jgi:hypothetical protein
MKNDCYERSIAWAHIVQEELSKSLYKHVKYDVTVSVALVSTDKEVPSLQNFIRTSDRCVKLDALHSMIFYYYTNIQEGHFAIKNLYTKLQNQNFHPKIVCTDIKASDRYPQKLFQRLCAMSCELDKKGEKFLSASKIDETMNIYDVDLDDL